MRMYGLRGRDRKGSGTRHESKAERSRAEESRIGPDQVLGNVLHLRSKAVLTACWSKM